MKKIYLSALILSIGSMSFAQQQYNKKFSKSELLPTLNNETIVVGDVSFNKKAPGDVIWSEDFTGGFPAGWTSVDNTGANYMWVLQAAGTIPDAQYTTNVTTIAPTSGAAVSLIAGTSSTCSSSRLSP